MTLPDFKSICFLLSVLMSLGISPIARAEPGGDPPSSGLMPESISKDLGWSLQLPEDEKVVFKGVVNYDASGSSGSAMLYPAPNAVGLLAGLITHAIILESVKGKRKTAAQEAADKVLVPYQDVLQGYTHRELMQRALDKTVIDRPIKLFPFAEKSDAPWLIQNVPIFSLTQDQTALVLDNTISISQPGVPPYLNTIRVVSTAKDDPNLIAYWTANQGEKLKEVSAAMVADSVQIALNGVAGRLNSENTAYKTLRYFEGNTEKMERALLLSEHCNRVLIKTLRGWLMSVPAIQNEANTSSCAGAS